MNRIPAYERQEYLDMTTPTGLRNLADGLENGNHASEEMAKLFSRVLDLKLEKSPCDCIVTLGKFYIQQCDCQNSGDLAGAEAWCTKANLINPPTE